MLPMRNGYTCSPPRMGHKFAAQETAPEKASKHLKNWKVTIWHLIEQSSVERSEHSQPISAQFAMYHINSVIIIIRIIISWVI